MGILTNRRAVALTAGLFAIVFIAGLWIGRATASQQDNFTITRQGVLIFTQNNTTGEVWLLYWGDGKDGYGMPYHLSLGTPTMPQYVKRPLVIETIEP